MESRERQRKAFLKEIGIQTGPITHEDRKREDGSKKYDPATGEWTGPVSDELKECVPMAFSENPAERKKAMERAGKQGSAKEWAVKLLHAGLDDPENDVRFDALEGLGRIGADDPRTRSRLADIAGRQNGHSKEFQETAGKILEGIRNKDAEERRLNQQRIDKQLAKTRGPNDRARLAAVNELRTTLVQWDFVVSTGKYRVLDRLQEMTDDDKEKPEVRKAAAEMLIDIGILAGSNKEVLGSEYSRDFSKMQAMSILADLAYPDISREEIQKVALGTSSPALYKHAVKCLERLDAIDKDRATNTQETKGRKSKVA